MGRLIFSILFLLLALRVPWPGVDARAAETADQDACPIHFSGNLALSNKTLLEAARPELKTVVACGFRRSVIDDAAFLMELAYHNAGYPEAVVEYLFDAKKPETGIAFIIREGHRVMVREVVFVGVVQARLKELLSGVDQPTREQILAREPFPYVRKEMASLAAVLRQAYSDQGFLDAVVNEPEIDMTPADDTVAVSIRVKEGTKYQLDAIGFSGDFPEAALPDLNRIATDLQGQTYFPRRKLFLRSMVTELLGNLGYPQATCTVTAEKQPATGRVDLQALIKSGPLVRIGELLVTGNHRTRDSFIKNHLTVEPGELLRLEDKRRSFSNLYQSGLFSKVSINLGDQDEYGARELLINVEEKPAREVFLEPGWGSYELARLLAGFRDRNLFGTGRIFRLDGDLSVMGRGAEASLLDPWFFGSQIAFDLPVDYRYRREPFFTMEKAGIGFFFSRKFTNQSLVSSGYRYSSNDITDIDPDVDRDLLANNYNNGSVILQVVRDTRNDLFFPASGYQGHFSLELADPALGGQLAYYRLAAGFRTFHPLGQRLILGLRYHTGFILPTHGDQGIPVSERFFNGGESTVRSFRESRLGPVDANGDALGGTAFNVASLELRYRLAEHLSGTLFVDVGNVAPNRTLVDGETPLVAERAPLTAATWRDYFRDWRPGIGCGVQYLLPVGPARLDLAFNPAPKDERSEIDYLVQFSIGMAF